MSAPATIHACALVIGETGVLIRGASGAGKSSLVLALLEAAAAKGLFARLVADDRVALRASETRIFHRFGGARRTPLTPRLDPAYP